MQRWEFQDDLLRRHVVTFEHGRWSRWQTVTVDGAVVIHVRRGLDATGMHQFTFAGHAGIVIVKQVRLGYRYELYVDGQSVAPQGTRLTPVDASSSPRAAAVASASTTRPRYSSALSWLYWIAGASLVNGFLYHSGSSVVFPVGAMFGFIIEGLVMAFGAPFGWIGHPVVALGFYLIARRVRAGSSRALKLGIALYALDSVFDTLIAFDALLVGLRVLALWGMIASLRGPKPAPAAVPVTS